MRLQIIVGIVAFLLGSTGLMAQVAHDVPPGTTDAWAWEDGNQLYEQCQSADQFDHSLCMAYIRGVTDMIGMLQDAYDKEDKSFWKFTAVCLPKNANSAQVADVVVKYMKENPEGRASKASVIVMRALIKAWGCPAT